MTTLRNARTADGTVLDVVLDPVAGTVTAAAPAAGPEVPIGAGEDDLTGFLLLPAPAEPHAHLDKALLGQRHPNRTGDLPGAIEAMIAMLPTITHDDIVERATQAALLLLGNGTTAIRSHADVGSFVGIRHVEALVEVREALRDLMTIQVVSLTSSPLTGPDGQVNAGLLRDALAAGADIAGGCPHLDADPLGCLEVCLDAAEAAGVPLDLHTDENTDPGSHGLADLAEAVMARGFGHGVVAGHCCSLGVQSPTRARATAEAVARAGIAVVANPQTNLFLQGRDDPVATPRGLTAVRALLDAGALVAAGGDNIRDPFNTMGRGDAFEAASLLVVAGHLLPEEAYAAVSSSARAAMGLPAVSLAAGSPAELLAVRAASLTDAIAAAPADRRVYAKGRLVAVTESTRTYPAGAGRAPAGRVA